MSKVRVFMTAAGILPPVPAFASLPLDLSYPGARLVPVDGSVEIAGEVWSFKDVRSIVLDASGAPWPAVASGSQPTVIAPVRIASDCTVSVVGLAGSVVEESDDRLVVVTAFGGATAGTA